ncbi:MAG: 30S ribosomal protein S7 [Rickettsiales bacterium]|jgi:small subunit ribosomal protein S7|nr:30S ribosomal protein S7 [Rickettsiales bacterium]
MSRRRKAVKRKITPDSRYSSVLVAKFINFVMEQGKKTVAEAIVYDAFDMMQEKGKKEDPLEAFVEAIAAVEPRLEVKSRRVGGATYQVPIDVEKGRANVLAIRWILAAVKKRKERTASARLYSEVMDILSGRGNSLKTRENTHKMAEANRAFAHYKW